MALRTLLLGSAALFVLAGTAQAGDDKNGCCGLRGTYISVEAGASLVGGERFFEDFIFPSSNFNYTEYRLQFETGWAFLASVGYAFDNHWRVELEGGYRHNGFEQLYGSSSSHLASGGKLDEWTVMANVLYDIQLSKRWSLSVGAGIGGDYADFDVDFIHFSRSDWTLAYQGLAGINYQIGDQTQLFLNYRYMNVDRPEYDMGIDGFPGGKHRVHFLGDLEKQALTLGLRFDLYGCEAPPPPPPPEAPPPVPPPQSHPKQFIVFFGFNKFNLTAEAQRVIEEAASAVKEYGAASVEVVGHTDSSGSTGYNQKLSERRSQTVRNALEALGIPSDNIHTSAKGESELMIETGDGVKEPQNRRATIDME